RDGAGRGAASDGIGGGAARRRRRSAPPASRLSSAPAGSASRRSLFSLPRAPLASTISAVQPAADTSGHHRGSAVKPVARWKIATIAPAVANQTSLLTVSAVSKAESEYNAAAIITFRTTA